MICEADFLLTGNSPPSLEPYQQTARSSSVRHPDKQLRNVCKQLNTQNKEIPIYKNVSRLRQKGSQ